MVAFRTSQSKPRAEPPAVVVVVVPASAAAGVVVVMVPGGVAVVETLAPGMPLIVYFDT